MLNFLRASSPKINYTRGMSFQRNNSSVLRNLPPTASAMDRVIAGKDCVYGYVYGYVYVNGVLPCLVGIMCVLSAA
ncbi:hypothetical protein EON63_12450 [archaeon]|nr:MAG: hypothetical protein EON63_12450 [archaeon]